MSDWCKQLLCTLVGEKGKKENRGFLICISLVGCPPACLLKLVNGDARSFPTNTWKANWDILCKLDRYAGCTTTFQTPSTLKFTKIQSIFSISSYEQERERLLSMEQLLINSADNLGFLFCPYHTNKETKNLLWTLVTFKN